MEVKLLSPEEITTIGVGAPRKVYFPESVRELRSLLKENLPVIGGGSNAVLSDSTTPLISTALFRNCTFNGDTVTLGAGVRLSQVLKLQQKMKFSLFEFLAGIPRATVGGLVAQNAGAFGEEVKKRLLSITYFDTESGEVLEMEKEEIERGFGYRKTPFPEKGTILNATFKIRYEPEIRKKIAGFVSMRLSKQPPFYLKTAGSTFKNPEVESAGRLLDLAGLKGFSIGRIGFSNIHANFVINQGGATFSEFEQLFKLAVEKVQHLFNVQLEAEIKIF